MRHNSEGGSCSDVKNVKSTALTLEESHQEESGTENVYENVTFFQGSAKFGQTAKTCVKLTEDWERLNTVTNNGTHLDRRLGVTCP